MHPRRFDLLCTCEHQARHAPDDATAHDKHTPRRATLFGIDRTQTMRESERELCAYARVRVRCAGVPMLAQPDMHIRISPPRALLARESAAQAVLMSTKWRRGANLLISHPKVAVRAPSLCRHGRFPASAGSISEVTSSDATQGRRDVVQGPGHSAMTLQDRNFGRQGAPTTRPLPGARCGRRRAAKLRCRLQYGLASPVPDSALHHRHQRIGNSAPKHRNVGSLRTNRAWVLDQDGSRNYPAMARLG